MAAVSLWKGFRGQQTEESHSCSEVMRLWDEEWAGDSEAVELILGEFSAQWESFCFTADCFEK